MKRILPEHRRILSGSTSVHAIASALQAAIVVAALGDRGGTR